MLKFHHTGIACRDIEKCVAQYRAHFGSSIFSESNTIFDPEQNANLKLITLSDGTSVEFISGEMVEGLIKKGRDIYHVCYESNAFEEDVNNFISNGAMPISAAKPAVLFHNRLVQFFMTSYGIVELLEFNNET
ncbi:VOC family protein [Vibrio chagasii]|uniref:VOC family protein n=1 Tax=Vibrio chagasii TaxID=170679 RepID=UPI0035A6E8F9